MASVFCTAALGLVALTGCEGGDLYNLDSPDWISEKVDSINNSKTGDVVTISPLTLGATDCSDAFWGSHLDSDILLESQKIYTIGFTNYSSGASNWNNWYVVLRSKDQATEYAVLRSDNYGWATNWTDYGWTSSTNASDNWETWLAAMNGAHCTAVITNYGDNTADVVVTMEGTDGNTYVQSYTGIKVNSSDLYLDFTTDGSYYVFDSEEVQVESAVDQQPVSMELTNVPDEVNVGTTFEEFTSGITAQVTYDGGSVKEVTSADLDFIVVPDFETVGDKYVVATLNKTYFGKTADAQINASAAFKVVKAPVSISITSQPTHTDYYFCNILSGTDDRTLTFDPTGMQVEATYADGTTGILDNSKLTFSTVGAYEGAQNVTITTENGKTATVKVNVHESEQTAISISPATLGATDNSTGWWTEFTNDVKIPVGATYVTSFTNYGSMAGNWNNYVVILRKADLTEYAVVRADNYGWGNGYGTATLINNADDWATWLAAMNGAHVTLYVTNCGNGQADVQAVCEGTNGETYQQGYIGISTIEPEDLCLAFTVDSSHLVFDNAGAKAHKAKRHRR